jgi:RNA ligase
MTLHYEFPKNITLEEVQAIVNDNPNFYIGERDGYVVANYLVAGKDTHPQVIDRRTAVMREMRGLIFDTDGKILSRRLHKFFNFGEREDVSMIDLSKHHVILEKLDGSMITPLMINSQLNWATKMGITDVSAQAAEFVSKSTIPYERFVLNVIEQDCTPIFEWCSRSQQIVIDYPEDRLVLIAVRDNETGEYVSFDRLCHDLQIPMVQTMEPISDLDTFIQELRKREDIEGVVIRFDDGHMVKLKTDTYVSLHRAKSLLENEKDVIALILDNKVDDLYSLLSDVDKARLKKFATDIMHDITVFCDEVNYILEDLHKKTVTRKDFALNFKHIDDTMRTFVFANWDSRCTIESVITFVMSHLGSNRSFQKCNTIIKHDW